MWAMLISMFDHADMHMVSPFYSEYTEGLTTLCIWHPQTSATRIVDIRGADVAIDVNPVATWEADEAMGGRNSCPSL